MSFYTVGTFWVTAAGVVISLGVGLAAALIALRSAPKRRLFYSISEPVPLVAPDGAKHGLEVLREGQRLRDPRLVEVMLQSSGRQSINSALFDQGRPLVIRFQTPIVALLKVTTDPSEQAIPDYRISDSTLEIGLGVLAARQRITFNFMVDGQPNLEVIRCPFTGGLVKGCAVTWACVGRFAGRWCRRA